jgi:hypothetical protein
VIQHHALQHLHFGAARRAVRQSRQPTLKLCHQEGGHGEGVSENVYLVRTRGYSQNCDGLLLPCQLKHTHAYKRE